VRQTILVVDNDKNIRNTIKAFLESEGFIVVAVETGDEAIALIRQRTLKLSAAMMDYHLTEEVDGLKGSTIIKRIRELDARLPIIGISADHSDEAHNDSLDSGAMMFFRKDDGNKKMLGVIHRACRESDRMNKPFAPPNHAATGAQTKGVKMVGVSDHVAEISRLILKMAMSDESVLIRGENGTGKELVARALHENSGRRQKPFIAVNCGSINPELIASDLFGHEKGAFTGAVGTKIGKFQAAEGGTLFLDEIGEMASEAQVALLRVLQEKEVTPVGSNISKPINVRVVAATNAPIEEKIKIGQFRLDLLHRLNVLPINLIPLRDRREDIPILIEHFMTELNETGRCKKIILEFCVEELKKLSWPGNIRDLKNVVIRMFELTDGPVINEESLDLFAPAFAVQGGTERVVNLDVLECKYAEEQIDCIEEGLRVSNNLNETARFLKIDRSRLRSRMKALNINNPFKD
jgi:DNA-binding NtrC family response regulator